MGKPDFVETPTLEHLSRWLQILRMTRSMDFTTFAVWCGRDMTYSDEIAMLVVMKSLGVRKYRTIGGDLLIKELYPPTKAPFPQYFTSLVCMRWLWERLRFFDERGDDGSGDLLPGGPEG